MANPQIIVDYIANTAKLKAAGGDISSTGAKIGAGFRKALVPATLALGAVSVAVGKTIDDASNLSEQVNKTGVVFGKASKGVLDWSKTTASAIGISSRAALEAAGTFGNMLVPMGFARGKAAEMSRSMVNLAADMASFNNASPEETLEAIRSGLAGESEPLRRFGVFLSDARLKQEAMNLGLYKGKGALDAHAKAQATYALILKDTADAQGDFSRTSDSVANQQRIMAAQAEELRAKFGTALLPAMQAVLGVATALFAVFNGHVGVLQVMVGVVAALATVVIAVNAAMAVWSALSTAAAAATRVYAAAQWLLNAALTANPIGLVVVALAALVAALVIAYKQSETFRRIVNAAFAGVLAAAKAVWNWIKANWPLLIGIIAGPLGVALALVIRHWGEIRAATQAAWNAVVNLVRNAVTSLVNAIRGGVAGAASAARAVLNAVKNVFSGAGHLLYSAGVAIISGLADGIRAAGGRVISAAQAVVDRVKGLISGAKGFLFGSPSRWAIERGRLITEGLALGMLQGRRSLDRALAGIAPSSIGGPTLAASVTGGGLQVRVFIGDQELRGLVRAEIVGDNARLARTLLAGGR